MWHMNILQVIQRTFEEKSGINLTLIAPQQELPNLVPELGARPTFPAPHNHILRHMHWVGHDIAT